MNENKYLFNAPYRPLIINHDANKFPTPERAFPARQVCCGNTSNRSTQVVNIVIRK